MPNDYSMAERDAALVEVLRGLESRGHAVTADDVRTLLDGDEVALRPAVPAPQPPQTPEEVRRAEGERMLAHMRRSGIRAAGQ